MCKHKWKDITWPTASATILECENCGCLVAGGSGVEPLAIFFGLTILVGLTIWFLY